MRKRHVYFVAFGISILGILLITGFYSYAGLPIPRVRSHDNWSIGIYTGDTPFHFGQPADVRNPVLTILDVTDVPARFLADPFMVREFDTSYMFFEVLNLDTGHGDIAVATSKDTRQWAYERIVLDEPFHLSYPYVFKWQDEYYMVPESGEADSVRLYKADEFPVRWSYVATLLEGAGFLDNSLAYFNDRWWMFSSFAGNDTLRLYFADDLYGPWQEHPRSPVVQGNIAIARPGGRAMVYNDRLFRYAQDGERNYGYQIWAFEITDISPDRYQEQLVSQTPVVKASGAGWNRDAMHNVDPLPLPDGRWITPVDGSGPIQIIDLKFWRKILY